MTSTIQHLSAQVNKAIAAIKDSDTVSVPVLVVKLEKIIDQDPGDYTVKAMHRVLSRLETNHKNFISKALLKDVYQKHYVSGTRFAEYFADELGSLPQPLSPKYASAPQKPLDPYSDADPTLANALASIMDNEPVRMFSKDAAKQAVRVVGNQLDLWNLSASGLNVVAGNDQFLVVQADYETPKGKTSVFLPVEVVKGKALEPMLFMANAGAKELNNTNLKTYLTANAGARLDIKPQTIVDTLTSQFSKQEPISEVVLAAIKINADKQVQVPYFSDTVLGQKVDPEVKNAIVEMPRSGQFQSFAEKFSTPLGVANFKFGVDKVNLGRDAIVRVLGGFGIKSPSIVVSSVSDNTVGYAVSLNDHRVSFNVPVKFANNRVLLPDVLVCNGAVKPLTKQSIGSLLANKESDQRAYAATSPQYGLTSADLIDNVRAAVLEANHSKAEDALGVLASKDDQVAYKTALGVYMDGLSSKGETSKCSLVVQSKTSHTPICGHTGLPLDKVYQDKNGACAPLYHRKLAENYTPALMNTYKVF